MPLPKCSKNPQADADNFNARFKVGDTVTYREIQGEGGGEQFKVRAPAQVLGQHTAVVWLEGKAGCVCVAHCEAANAPVYASCAINDRAAIEAAFGQDQDAEDMAALRGAA